MRAEMVTGWTMNSANDGFTLGDQEFIGRERCAQ
jgi:hypothetical protein